MRKLRLVICVCILLLIFCIRSYIFDNKYHNDENNKEYIVMVESLKAYSYEKVSYNVIIGKQYNNKLCFNDKFILNLYKDKFGKETVDLASYSNFKYGDVLKLKGKITIPEKLNNPGEFDYKLYLYSNNIYGTINSYSVVEKIDYELNFKETIFKNINQFKQYIGSVIDNIQDEKSSNLVKALLYGDKLNLDVDTKQSFENAGISHILSVSGSNVLSFILIMKIFFNKQNRKKIVYTIVLVILTSIYAIFTGLGISIVRYLLIMCISLLLKVTGKKFSKFTPIILSLIVICINNPFAIFNVGLRLSYMAVLGITMFKTYIEKILNSKIKVGKAGFKFKVKGYITTNIAITLAVKIMILPIQISSFNSLSLPIIIPNLIISVILIPIRLIGIIAVIISFIPSIASKLFVLTGIMASLVIKIVNLLQNCSLIIHVKSLPLLIYVFYYILVLLIFVIVKLRNLTKNKKSKINFKKLIQCLKKLTVVILVLLVILVVIINVYSKYFAKYVYFFNVEQGDMSYIKYNQDSVIVDIGSQKSNLAFNVISNFFKSENIIGVDYIILSHLHADHINGLEEYLKNYNVKEIIFSLPQNFDDAYFEFKKILEKYNVKAREVKAGDIVKLQNLKIEILLPNDNFINGKDSENENSLICKISSGKTTLLYMGDAGKEAEKKLLNNPFNVDILKIGHHGSKTGTSLEFIEVYKPKYAIISAKKKYYGHPDEQVEGILRENNVRTYITEKIGAIRFRLN